MWPLWHPDKSPKALSAWPHDVAFWYFIGIVGKIVPFDDIDFWVLFEAASLKDPDDDAEKLLEYMEA
jgi:hypothetical protein